MIELGTSLTPGGTGVVGMGLASGGIPRGLRTLDLGEPASPKTLATLGEESWTFAERVSPDGKELAFATLNWVPGRVTLERMDLATRAIERLWINTEEATEFARFGWLPDRSGLVGQLWGLNRFRMAKFDFATRTMTVLSDWIVPDRLTPTMRLSRDGRTIAYNTQEGDLRFITLDGSIASGYPTDLKGLYPAFSPDGKFLAYMKVFTEPSFRVDGVWIYRFSDGSTWRLLPEGSGISMVLDWE